MINTLNAICLHIASKFSIFMKTVESLAHNFCLIWIPGSLSCTLDPDTAKNVCQKVKWCAIGHLERVKCDEWSINSAGKIECETAETTEDCIAKIMVCHSCLHKAVAACLSLRLSIPGNDMKTQVHRNLALTVGAQAHRRCSTFELVDLMGSVGFHFLLVSAYGRGQSEQCLLREAGPWCGNVWDPQCAMMRVTGPCWLCKQVEV